jgi:hypothetical protein
VRAFKSACFLNCPKLWALETPAAPLPFTCPFG